MTEKCKQMLHNGFFHVSGCDKLNRPVVVICPRIMFETNPTAQEVITAATFAFLFVREHLLIEGKSENFIIV